MTTKIKLKKSEREFLKLFVRKGKRKARQIVRANILLLADEGERTKRISQATGTTRQMIWRVKKNYSEHGVKAALEDKPRPGQPVKYDKKKQAQIIATACTQAPKGRKRWTVRLLTEELKKYGGFKSINRESVRLFLKKTGRSLG
jgi:transposase